jgi:glycine hydroxymethyltransferase
VVKNCQVLAESLLEHGFNLVSGGTDNHLVLIDLRNKKLTGKAAEERLDKVGLTVNKNTVPFETESPFVTSGIRLGTPSITTRGLGETEMRWLAKTIAGVIDDGSDENLQRQREAVRQICKQFPLYPEN